MRLLAVPNVSEGRDAAVLDAIQAAFAEHADVLHRSQDPDHHRAVFMLAAPPGRLHRALARGAAIASAQIDLHRHDGLHPRVGALDVAPVVYLDDADRGAAIAEALLAADAIGATGVPVFLYGEVAGGGTRAELRQGGSGARPAPPGRAGVPDGRGRRRPPPPRAAQGRSGAARGPPRAQGARAGLRPAPA